jgi:hypothetical protein
MRKFEEKKKTANPKVNKIVRTASSINKEKARPN